MSSTSSVLAGTATHSPARVGPRRGAATLFALGLLLLSIGCGDETHGPGVGQTASQPKNGETAPPHAIALGSDADSLPEHFAKLLPDAAAKLAALNRGFKQTDSGAIVSVTPTLRHPAETWLSVEVNRRDGKIRYAREESASEWIELDDALQQVNLSVDGTTLTALTSPQESLWLLGTRRMEQFTLVPSATDVPELKHTLTLGPELARAEVYELTGDVIVVNHLDDWRLVIEHPVAHDSAGQSMHGRWSIAVGSEPGTYDLHGQIDLEHATFPVLLDPTVSVPSWILKTPSVSPPPLRNHAMTFDSGRSRVVLYGGQSSSANASCIADAWEWDGQTWDNRSNGSGPGLRLRAAFVYDPVLQQSVLHGGNDCLGPADTVTYGWNGSAWSALPSSGAPPGWRFSIAAAYDVERSRAVLFGNRYIFDNEVYEYVAGQGWLNPQPSTRPWERGTSTAFFDEELRQTIIFSGAVSCCPPAKNDTWGWDGTNWVNYVTATSPAEREFAMSTYDSDRRVGVLYGGKDPDTCCDFFPSTYEWHDLNWHSIAVTPRPNAIYNAAMTYDSARHEAVLYGGIDPNAPVNSSTKSETWVYRTVEFDTDGEPCANSGECLSGYCVDGVCCATSCGLGSQTDCRACSVAAGAATDGTCGPVAAGQQQVCRSAIGDCDVEEICAGTTETCPSDQVASAATLCRGSSGPCDAEEHCTGSSAVCPLDGLVAAGVECREAQGACDLPEDCSGFSPNCPADLLASPNTVCRAIAGACDIAEVCDSGTVDCPPDELAPSGHECRAPSGACDQVEVCNGLVITCPVDAKAPAGTECRATAGTCDVVEVCDGANNICPRNALSPSTEICRASTSLCDAVELCSGLNPECPVDTLVPNGFTCDDGNGCTQQDICNEGLCVGTAPIVCAAFDDCIVSAVCDPTTGTCRETPQADGEPCTNGACLGGVCLASDDETDQPDAAPPTTIADGGEETEPSPSQTSDASDLTTQSPETGDDEPSTLPSTDAPDPSPADTTTPEPEPGPMHSAPRTDSSGQQDSGTTALPDDSPEDSSESPSIQSAKSMPGCDCQVWGTSSKSLGWLAALIVLVAIAGRRVSICWATNVHP